MSIIYDALQKTQQSLGSKPTTSSNRRKFSKLNFIYIGIIICLFLALAFTWVPKIKLPKITSTKVPSSSNPSKKLVLQGVFESNNEKIALINNQTLHIGDSINGKKILSISLDEVKLQDDNGILTL